MQRNRSEFTFFFLSVLLLGLIIGNAFSGYVAAQTGSTYEDLELFSDALSIVQSEYVDEASTKDLIYGALRGMLNTLDPHSQFMKPDTYKDLKVETEGHFGGLGIVISLDEHKVLTVVSPIEDTPAFRAGVQAGDKIIKIEDEDTHGLVLEEAVKKLRGPKGSKVTITVLRLHENNGHMPEELEFTLTRDDIKIRSVKARMLDNNIGYIRLVEFSEHTGRDLQKAIDELTAEGMHSIVLDLRNNPGGLLNVAAEVSDKFLQRGRLIVYTESRNTDQNLRFTAKQDATLDSGTPIVVLVNHGSASASEIVAGALRDWNRAVIMGENTFGKGSVQSIIPLSDGSALRLTTAKYLTPDGHTISDVGITPDIEVKMSKRHVALLLSRVDIPEEDGDVTKVKVKNGDGEEEEIVDIQLERAVDLLQGYDIFKTIEQNINIAKNNGETMPEADEVEGEEGTELLPLEPTILEDLIEGTEDLKLESHPEIMAPQPEEVPIEQ